MTASHWALEVAVAAISDEQWEGTNSDVSSGGLEDLLHAIIYHDLYHAGQIAILKKS